MAWPYKFILKNKYGFTQEELELHKSLNKNSLAGTEKKFISQAKFQSLRKYLDSPSWRPIVHNKWITANFFHSNTINQPELYGLLHPRFGCTLDGSPLTSGKELEALVKEKNLGSFVFKHIGGGKGNAVFIIDDIRKSGDNLVFLTTDNRELTSSNIDEILKKVSGGLQGYIVQEKLELHPILRELTKAGLSSVRINTLFTKHGECIPQMAYVRLGVDGKATDHAINGGIMVPVELKSGIMQKGIDMDGNDKWITTHPYSKIRFAGLKIPDWHVAIQMVIEAAGRCPGLNWIGWDLVMTADGPFLIEANVGLDIMPVQQLVGGFIENGIFDEWIEELELPEEEKNAYSALNHWKRQYLLQHFRGIFNFGN